jgi:hypothetical protein
VHTISRVLLYGAMHLDCIGEGGLISNGKLGTHPVLTTDLLFYLDGSHLMPCVDRSKYCTQWCLMHVGEIYFARSNTRALS